MEIISCEAAGHHFLITRDDDRYTIYDTQLGVSGTGPSLNEAFERLHQETIREAHSSQELPIDSPWRWQDTQSRIQDAEKIRQILPQTVKRKI